MLVRPPLPFIEEEGVVKLTGPVFISCGCGQQTARWASISQNLVTKIPQGKPKSSKIIAKWIAQENLKEKFPLLTKHQYGLVVAETEEGIEGVDIMGGAAPKMAEKIGQLLRRNQEWKQQQSSSN